MEYKPQLARKESNETTPLAKKSTDNLRDLSTLVNKRGRSYLHGVSAVSSYNDYLTPASALSFSKPDNFF